MISRSRRDSVGGGVVAEFFRDLQEPISKSLRGSVGGGVVGGFFPLSPVAKSNFYPPLSDIRG